jgi:hypothetical protein
MQYKEMGQGPSSIGNGLARPSMVYFSSPKNISSPLGQGITLSANNMGSAGLTNPLFQNGHLFLRNHLLTFHELIFNILGLKYVLSKRNGLAHHRRTEF